MPQVLRVSTLLAGFQPGIVRVGQGTSAALDALLTEAALTGLMLDFRQDLAFRAGVQTSIAGVSGWSYTRTGTAYDLAGTTSFGANVPRRTSAGLLVEAGATNIVQRSQEFDNAYWTKASATITADAGVAPDGTNTADLMTLTSAGGRVQVSATTTSSAASIFVKVVAGTGLFAIDTNGASGADNTLFNLNTGTVTSTGANNLNSTITNVGNGWYRISTSRGATAGTTIFFGLATGSATNDQLLIWGAQLETGATASSYIPTTSTSASRGADAASVTGLTFSGAHSVIALVGANANVTGSYAFQFDDTTNSNRSVIYNAGGNASATFVVSGGVSQADTTNGVSSWLAAGQRMAARVNTNDVRGAVNGALGTADTVATLPAGTLSRVVLGYDPSTSNRAIGGPLQLVAILPRALSDTELQNATA